MHITPLFLCERASEAAALGEWALANFDRIREVAEATTAHGKLKSLEPVLLGRNLHLQFNYDTGDAMGLNMINIATERACEFIRTERGVARYYLRVNLSADKKNSHRKFVSGYGKEVLAEAVLPRKVVTRLLHTTPEELKDFWKAAVTAGMKAGITGVNAHLANGLAAMFIACGQDVAQIVNSAVGILDLDVTKEGDLYASLHLPNLVVGTVGGGTSLPTQRECLELLGCYGTGTVGKFAEIVAGTLLAGEISLCASLTNGDFAKVHAAKHEFTKTLAETDPT
jgi:hydroxymethylglutaryl-CoA reductase (NADPH)